MKLLLDENLPPILAQTLAQKYPGSIHVRDLLGPSAPDSQIWETARRQSMVIATKDADFTTFSTLFGHPPKVVLIALGNCTNEHLLELFRGSEERLIAFETDSKSTLVLP